jgi:multisubunit Na+/H+ antiporter MnhC subunit
MMGPMVSFAQNHPVLVILMIVLGIILLMVRKPKLFFSLIGLGLLLAGLVYVILSISGPGSEQKKKMVHEEEEQSDVDR